MIFKKARERSCFTFCIGCQKCSRFNPRYKICRECEYSEFNTGCDCPSGIIRHRTVKGEYILLKLPHSPYKGKTTFVEKSRDEIQWDEYVAYEREKRKDPTWSPITYDGEYIDP